ncbi:MAG: hypothetical protein KDE51_13535 [Anaerolineales bacterium]|nr:hypothetical protein [Anaerolineales bacterium]
MARENLTKIIHRMVSGHGASKVLTNGLILRYYYPDMDAPPEGQMHRLRLGREFKKKIRLTVQYDPVYPSTADIESIKEVLSQEPFDAQIIHVTDEWKVYTGPPDRHIYGVVEISWPIARVIRLF